MRTWPGAQAKLTISNVASLSGPNQATLYGSEGTVRFIRGKLLGGQRGASALEEIVIPGAEQGKWRVEEEFINAIRVLEPITHTTFEDGVRYMAFTEAVARSPASGKTIHLPVRGGTFEEAKISP